MCTFNYVRCMCLYIYISTSLSLSPSPFGRTPHGMAGLLNGGLRGRPAGHLERQGSGFHRRQADKVLQLCLYTLYNMYICQERYGYTCMYITRYTYLYLHMCISIYIYVHIPMYKDMCGIEPKRRYYGRSGVGVGRIGTKGRLWAWYKVSAVIRFWV